MKMIKGLENLCYEERLKELGGRDGSGGPHHSIPVLKGWLQRGQRLSLHKEPHGEDKANGYKLYMERFHLNIRKKLFAVRTVDHWNNLLRDVVESPLLEVFKIVVV
ncbi:hypothetical protein GRJ2_000822800 [Grus japonensis]|uniref:Uncharacterized protein n=1 Tax=Grus japonensis TaxID=30415 RepID=A0ABC9WE35_GRUJA